MKKLIEETYNKNKDYFYKKELENQGIKFTLYNYHIMSTALLHPIACEFRGLLVSENGDVIPSINKFFNYNELQEIESYHKQYNEIEVYDKLDGSLITAFFLQNKLFVKSKASFKRHQAQLAKQFINENKHYFYFIYECYKLGLYPQFELVSPQNRIVVSYKDTRLILLALRYIKDNKIEYMDYDDMINIAEKFNIDYVKKYNYNIDDLLKMRDKVEGIEGWVIKAKGNFPNFAKFAKIKTNWYIERHKIFNLSLSYIIDLILQEKIDDVLEYAPDKKYIENIINKVSKKYEELYKETMKLIELEKNGMSRKEIAQNYRFIIVNGVVEKNPAFILYTRLKKKDIDEVIKAYIKTHTRRVSKAQKFLGL